MISKEPDGIGAYNMLKILNNLLFIATLCLSIGYW